VTVAGKAATSVAAPRGEGRTKTKKTVEKGIAA
jgi:hypothetical protein